MLEVGRDRRHEPGADPLHVVVEPLVTQERQLLASLGGRLLAQLHVVADRVAVLRGSDLGLRGRGGHRRRDEQRRNSAGISLSGHPCSHIAGQCKGGTSLPCGDSN